MKPITTRTVIACVAVAVALALCGGGSSSDEQPRSTQAEVTSAFAAITADVQKIKDAQTDLTPERKQQVQDAVTSFGTQLETIVRDAVAGLATTDAKTQATDAAASLKSAVSESLQPIDC